MKVADYVIQELGRRGIDTVFVVYGAANGDLIDAFTRTDQTRYIAVMHEQAGGFAAEGWAKVSGKVGCAIATSGPGGMNLVTPIGNCFYDSVPCLFLTGQINSKFLRSSPRLRQVGFQETDICGIVRPITKDARMVMEPTRIRYELERALWLAAEGRPGPVLLDLPLDVQKAEVEPDRLESFTPPTGWSGDEKLMPAQLEMFLRDLRLARRPVILVGGGVRSAGAVDDMRAVATALGVPCFPTWNALDIITSDHPCYGGRVGTYGGCGRNFAIQNADLLLAVGSRISGRITGGAPSTFARGAKKYLVDIDAALCERNLQQVPFDVSIHCDAKVFLKALVDSLDRRVLWEDKDGWRHRVREWRDRYDPVRPEFYDQPAPVNPYVFFRALSEAMDPEDILVGDCGGNIVTLGHAFETKTGQRVLTNNGNSPMGFSFSAALGARLAAHPASGVVCTIGDGGFNMNLQELQTMLTYGLDVKTFIVNNQCYGITKAFQETNFDGRAEACGPKGYRAPDFVAIAKAYGVPTAHLRCQSGLRDTLRAILASDGPIVCDVDCGDWHTYEPRIVGWGTPIEEMSPRLPRAEFRQNMVIGPLPGWEDQG